MLSEVPPLLRHPTALDEALAGLRGPVALDTEFHAEHVYTPRLMLVQLRGAGGEPLLVDPLGISDLRPLGRALERLPLLVHAHSQDLLLLARCAGWSPRPGQVMDPQVLAGFCGLGYPRSLGDLVAEVLGRALPPSSSMSDWGKRPLSDEQRRYAAADVLWLHELVDALQARLDPERRAWAQRATDELVQAALAPVPPEARWQRIGGAAVLDGPGRAALAALVAWREDHAQALNQPRWQVATDVVLLDLARRRPRSLEELGGNRKLPRKLLGQWGEELLGVLAEAARGPEPEGRVYNRGGPLALEVHLHAWALGVEVERGLAAELLLPADLRRAIVWRWARGEAAPPLEGWRAEAIGEELHALLRGERALRISPAWRPREG